MFLTDYELVLLMRKAYDLAIEVDQDYDDGHAGDATTMASSIIFHLIQRQVAIKSGTWTEDATYFSISPKPPNVTIPITSRPYTHA
jgi:hypothetical protein